VVRYADTDEQSAIVPSLSEITHNIKVANPEIKTSYIPRLKACDGVYIGNAIAQEGRVNLKIINTLEETLQLHIPTLELQEIEQIRQIKEDAPNINEEIKRINAIELEQEEMEETQEEISESRKTLSQICWDQIMEYEDHARHKGCLH
jgi:hypothetical protein